MGGELRLLRDLSRRRCRSPHCRASTPTAPTWCSPAASFRRRKHVPVDGRPRGVGPLELGQRLHRRRLDRRRHQGRRAAAASALPRTAVMPNRTQVTIVKNWDVNGLKGTGSHDIVVDKVVVPERLDLRSRRPARVSTPRSINIRRWRSRRKCSPSSRWGWRAPRSMTSSRDRRRPRLDHGRAGARGSRLRADRAWPKRKPHCARRAPSSMRRRTEAYETLCAGAASSISRAKNLLRLSSSHAAKVGSQVAHDRVSFVRHHGDFQCAPHRATVPRCAHRAATRVSCPTGRGKTPAACCSGSTRRRAFRKGQPDEICRTEGSTDDDRLAEKPFRVAVLRRRAAKLFRSAGERDRHRVGKPPAPCSRASAICRASRFSARSTTTKPWSAPRRAAGRGPFTFMADVPDRATAVAVCNLFRTTPSATPPVEVHARRSAHRPRARDSA